MGFDIDETYVKKYINNYKEKSFVSDLEYILVKGKKIYISEDLLSKIETFSFKHLDIIEIIERSLSDLDIMEIIECSLSDLIANYFNKCEKIRTFLFKIIEYKIEEKQFNNCDFIYIYKICRLHNIALKMEFTEIINLIFELIPLFNKMCGKIIDNGNLNFFTIDNRKIDYNVYLMSLILNNKIKIVELFKTMFDYCDLDSFRALSFLHIENFDEKLLEQLSKEVTKGATFFDVSFPEDKIDIYSSFYKSHAALELIYGVFLNHPKLRIPSTSYFKYKIKLFTDKEIDVLEDIVPKIHSLGILDDLSINFYIIAEQMFEDLQYTPLVDYSSCALQYYKIIELILKRYLFVRNYKDRDVSQIYKDIAPWMKLNPCIYNRDWLKTVTLEKIYHFVDHFLFLRKELENNKNPLSSYSIETIKFLDDLNKNFPLNKTFEFIKKVVHRKVLNTYRNPAAHTHPCTRETAKEAK